MVADHWKPTRAILNAIFVSYYYNRSVYHMLDLCKELRARLDRNIEVECTDDGDIIYGILVLLYGDYGTSPRSGWINENIENIKICIDEAIKDYEEAIS